MYMTDYSKMSDFEINKAAGSAAGYATGIEPCFEVVIINKTGRPFDPCNNPADAWPIIVEHSISLIMHDEYKGQPWFACKGRIDATHANPLRAAMIVFLMMKEAENV
jgi:Bacteriophage P22, NinX